MGKKAFGEQSPNQGEDAIAWTTWSDGDGGAAVTSGDASWGKLHLQLSGAEGRSAVYDTGYTGDHNFTLAENRYGTGTGDATLQIRGSNTSFSQDDALPAWENYSATLVRAWRYVQVREITTDYLLLGVSASGRYLVDGLARPWLLLSDSPQGMLVACTTAEMDTYFSARAAQGFNCTQVHIVAGTSFGGVSNTTYETYDGVKPFSTNGDISTVNETYFARLDTLLTTAAKYGIVVTLNATEHIDAGDLWETNGNTKCYNYGAYLGNRYKDYPNIIWMIGNDFQDWSTDAGKVAADINVINGIQSADTNHLIYTMWLEYYRSASRDSTDFNAECTLNAAYTYWVAYDLVVEEYAVTPAKPVFLIETCYEKQANAGYTGTPFLIRKQNYWSMLAGACGVTIMNDHWNFSAGWDTSMNDTCFTQAIHFKNLFEAFQWWNLAPDTTNTWLTAGYGTARTGETIPTTDDYANCAYLADGSLAIIYMPENMTLTVDMSEFSGTVTCRWYDPTSGQYEDDAASPHTNSGTHNFSHAGANDASETDWILVLSV